MANPPLGVVEGLAEERTTPLPHHEPRKLDPLTHRQLVGYLGVALSPGVYVLAGYLPTAGITGPWTRLDSISAYYYTGAGNFFEGTLFGIGMFLVTYPGYQGVWKDRIVGFIGGLAALGVALFPTEPPQGIEAAQWWSKTVGYIHVGSAVALFASFAGFALWLFPKSDKRWRERLPEKRRRDVFSYLCGATIVACMLWIGTLAWPVWQARETNPSAPGPDIFWPEAIAVLAFALAWLVKGEAPDSILRAPATIKRAPSAVMAKIRQVAREART